MQLLRPTHQVEWLIRENELAIDLQLIPVLLDHDQCVHYRLPCTPLKATEKRTTDWTHRYGEGGTELDALEAIHVREWRKSKKAAADEAAKAARKARGEPEPPSPQKVLVLKSDLVKLQEKRDAAVARARRAESGGVTAITCNK